MDVVSHTRGRGRGFGPDSRRPQSRNKQWVAGSPGPAPRSDGERWERGGHRGGRGGRGGDRGASWRAPRSDAHQRTESVESTEASGSGAGFLEEEAEPETPEERERFYQELVKAREVERKKAIAEGKMDDPLVPKRLEDAISMVGTCMDMCPRFERYRRERENNLTEWEMIPGTKRVNHQRAVKMYERAAGDKTLPSDLRPPEVLKRTLDYLFHDLLPSRGFTPTFSFIRDRSRAVRNDFTMQHDTGPVAIECHDRCARFHIIALHLQRDVEGFSIALEEQQLMNTLQSLKEFYEDQRGRYDSPTELEMRVYHRLIHIRDQRERHDDIPDHIRAHPVFQLTTDFRLHVQKKSAPISKISKLVVGPEGMEIFGKLAELLRQQGSMVMIYLIACVLERLFGKDAIDDIESLRGNMEIPDIIDGVSTIDNTGLTDVNVDQAFIEELEDELMEDKEQASPEPAPHAPTPLKPSATVWLSDTFPSAVPAPQNPSTSAFAGLSATPNAFAAPSPFGSSAFGQPNSPPKSAFVSSNVQPSAFAGLAFKATAPPADSARNALTDAPPLSNENVPPPTSSLPSNTISPFSGFQGSSSPSPFPSMPSFQSTGAGSSTTQEKTIANGFMVNGTASSTSSSPMPSLNPQALEFTPGLGIFTASSSQQHSPKTTEAPSIPIRSEPQAVPSSPPKPLFPSNAAAVPAPALGETRKHSGFNTSAFQPASTNQFLSPLSSWTSPAESSSSTPPGASILPKIDTSAAQGQVSSLESPRLPPALGRKAPISLPPTPTLTTPLARPHLGFLKNTLLQTPPGLPRDDVLSPLALQSPTVARGPLLLNLGPSTSPFSSPEKLSLKSPLVNGKGSLKGKEKAMVSDEDQRALEASALEFERRGFVVRDSFRHWQNRATDRAAWHEACRKSDAYQQKVQRERLIGSPTEKRRRRISHGLDGPPLDSPLKKRARKRVSDEYKPPRTDEELARRLKENQAEHERRWARGSFLQGLNTHIRSTAKSQGINVPPNWRAWLSLNPESDATAIWLERKFDIPESGSWESETIFSIPLTKSDPRSIPGYPGLLVFECTPLEGIKDELERKYRILDDCTRIRDMIKALPPRRYFVPSLLVLSWSDEERLGPDLEQMINAFIKDSTLRSSQIFAFTSATKDLDRKFDEALQSLRCDVEGQLVRSLSIQGIFQLFDSTLREFITEGLERCSHLGQVDWASVTKVINDVVDILNLVAKHTIELAGLELELAAMPSFDGDQVFDSGTLYDEVLGWLADEAFPNSADNVISDLESHRSMGRDFPASAFLDHLSELGRHHLLNHTSSEAAQQFYVLKADIEAHQTDVAHVIKALISNLTETMKLSIRRSPKRRSMSLVSDVSHLDVPATKRARLSESSSSYSRDASPPFLQVNGRSSPSPSVSSVSASQTDSSSVVTIAMLKALTRDIKSKYGVS